MAARASNERRIAFVGVDPLAANGMNELQFWSKQEGISGIKLPDSGGLSNRTYSHACHGRRADRLLSCWQHAIALGRVPLEERGFVEGQVP
jgi:hypothetical protein